MEAKYQEITLGEPVCGKLRDIYFRDIPWVDCHNDVIQKFTALKMIVSKFYSDKVLVEALKELVRYSEQDIIDVFAMDKAA
jgi:hypothetical protein